MMSIFIVIQRVQHMAPHKHILPILALLLVASCFCHSCSFADEVVIEGNSTEVVGDFMCSNCPEHSSAKLDLAGGEITAGKLWSEFNRRGLDHVERLTFLVPLEQFSATDGCELPPVQFKLDDYTASSHGNSLFVPVNDSGFSSPMAKLELDLPFDFMEKYSADSKEPIKVTSSDDDEAILSGVSIPFESGIRSSYLALIGFAGFWIAVFVLFNRLTKPTDTQPENTNSLQPPSNRRALSA